MKSNPNEKLNEAIIKADFFKIGKKEDLTNRFLEAFDNYLVIKKNKKYLIKK